jgi:hypothetical protein
MKKMIFLAATAFMAITAGCNKIKQLANINADIPYNVQVNVPLVAQDTPGTVLPSGGLSLPFPTVSFATNSQQYLSQYGTAANMVLNVYLKTLALQITSPASQNFDYLDSVQLYISANSQPEMLAAWAYNIPKGQSTLNFTTNTEVNLKNYFIQDTIYFRLQAHINSVPATGTELNIASVFHLLANPLD